MTLDYESFGEAVHAALLRVASTYRDTLKTRHSMRMFRVEFEQQVDYLGRIYNVPDGAVKSVIAYALGTIEFDGCSFLVTERELAIETGRVRRIV